MSSFDMTKYIGVPLNSIASLPNGGSYTLQVNGDSTYILVLKSAYEAMREENRALRERVAMLEAHIRDAGEEAEQGRDESK